MYVNPNPLRDPQDAPPAAWGDCGHEISVSYTHLTLPTIDDV